MNPAYAAPTIAAPATAAPAAAMTALTICSRIVNVSGAVRNTSDSFVARIIVKSLT